MDTMLLLILLVFEMMKIPRDKVEVHFRKKLAFVTNKCLTQGAFGKCPRTTENLSKHTVVAEYALISLWSCIFKKRNYPCK